MSYLVVINDSGPNTYFVHCDRCGLRAPTDAWEGIFVQVPTPKRVAHLHHCIDTDTCNLKAAVRSEPTLPRPRF